MWDELWTIFIKIYRNLHLNEKMRENLWLLFGSSGSNTR